MGIFDGVNTATTLSRLFKPGRDVRLGASNSESIFTFGTFRVETDFGSDTLSADSRNLIFDNFSTLESLGATTFEIDPGVFIKPSELNLDNKDPQTHAYFGSFYTEVANSINNIINTFPYAVLSSGASNVTEYSETITSTGNTSTFKLDINSLTNQGGIIYGDKGGFADKFGLVNDFNKFALQAKDDSDNTEIYPILDYEFSAGTYLKFTVKGRFLSNMTASTFTKAVYVRPSQERYNLYFSRELTSLESQILNSGAFEIPNVDDDESTLQSFTWPKTIDGFSPDNYGGNFDIFQNNILNAAARVDDSKTNFMLRTFVGENFTELDSDGEIFGKLIRIYGHQFDEIKKYVDAMAYAHSVGYSSEESVPDKFLFKLSKLLGWRLTDAFNEVDLFEYLAGDSDGNNTSYANYNIQIWKRILTNINWLYKKKGTRDALMFLFKVIGAPECLINLEEFVYDVKQTAPITGATSGLTVAQMISALKINDNGYPNYPEYGVGGEPTGVIEYVFQEGGQGRGNGQAYINQWRPEFDPKKRVDNIKVVTGDTVYFGSENVINSKEICINLDPAKVVECDVKDWYAQTGTTCWVWGSTGATLAFSSLTISYEHLPSNCEKVVPENIADMTIAEWVDYIFKSNVPAYNRKTNHQSHTTWHYPELKKIYMNYYLHTNPTSNQLTIEKLESFLTLLEVQIQDYIVQLLPATTILECFGTVYRNPIFHRQRFVYRDGLNDGSEFQTRINEYVPVLNPVKIDGRLPDVYSPSITPIVISSRVDTGISTSIKPVKVTAYIQTNTITTNIPTHRVTAKIMPGAIIVRSKGTPIGPIKVKGGGGINVLTIKP